MAEVYFPFNSVSGDRKYKAEDWARYFALFLRNGVFYSDATQLKVVAGEGMQVVLKAGNAFINGRCYCNTSDRIIEIDDADGALNRTDRVVVKCDYTGRVVGVAIKKSQYSAQPVAAELKRDADAYELALGDVYVAKGTIAITQSMITDQRLNNDLCGIVTSLVTQADTTDIFDQFQSYLSEFKQTYVTDMEDWTQQQQTAFSEWSEEQQDGWQEWYDETTESCEQQFTTWFEGIVGLLDGDIATTLAQRILVLEGKVTTLETDKAEKVLVDEQEPAAGATAQGFELFIEGGALKVRRVV